MKAMRLVVVTLLSLMFAGNALAVACDAVFSNAVGSTGGKLELDDNASLLNTGGGVLATDNLDAGNDHCDGQPCIESGTNAPTLTIPSHNTKTDFKDQSFAFAPGDHYYDKFELKDNNTITVTGAGQVRIHVRGDLKIDDQALVNVNGNPLDLIFLVRGKVEIKNEARVNAIIYAQKEIKVDDDAVVEGALVGKGAEIKGDASITFTPTGSLEIPGVCEPGTVTPPVIGPLDFSIEVGSLTIINTYDRPDFTRVNFTQQFDAPPLVFTLPTIDGGNSAAHRIRNVTSDGFDIMTLEPDGEDGPHVAMSLNYLAVERGVHDLPGGRKLVADTVDTKKVQAYANAGGGIGWSHVAFGGAFSQTPAVLAQIQTMVNEQETLIPAKPSRPWLTTAVADVGSNGMDIALERSESSTGSVGQKETIAFFAVEPVDRLRFKDSNDQTVDMEVIRTGELLQGWGTCAANRVNFSQPWPQTPVVLATKNTRDGDAGVGDGDGGWLRRCSTSTTYTELQVDEVRRNNIGDGNRLHDTRERAGVVAFTGNFVTKARQLDHFRMIHDGLGVTGVPETVTIQACRNVDCSQRYTGSVTVTLQPGNAVTSWSGSGVLANQVTFTGGTLDVSLHHVNPGTINIGLTGTPVPPNPTRCFVGATETCSITFASTAFVVTLPDQVSGGTSVGSVTVPTCWSDFQSKTVQVDIGAQYVSPVWTGPALTANGTTLPADGSTAAVDLVFDASCVASLQVAYADAGEIGVNVGFVGTGSLSGLTMSGADNAVFYPSSFRTAVVNASGTALNANAAGASPVHPSGGSFRLTVTALNSAGNVTQGYKPQALGRVMAYAQRTGPIPGSEGTFKFSATGDVPTRLNPPAGVGDYTSANVPPNNSLGGFVNGVYTNAAASYSEVGLITLYVLDYDYMGHVITATPLSVGRFTPDAFQVTPTILNRSATSGCGGGSFTYMGEQLRLRLQLIAKNASGGITRNYQGSFAPFSGAGFTRYAGVQGNTVGARVGATNLSSRLNLNAVNLSVPWAIGIATLDIDLTLQPATAADGPYDGTSLGLNFADSDGAALQGLDIDVDGNGSTDHLDLGPTNFRFGRLSVGNAHGSELRDLDVPVAMQFFAGPGQGFVTHTLDNCTPIAFTLIGDADTGDSLLVSDTCIVDQFGASGSNACAAGTAGNQYDGTANAGRYVVSLKSPGAGKTGGLRVTADAPDWAEFDWVSTGNINPAGVATFGIYNGNTEFIYQREIR